MDKQISELEEEKVRKYVREILNEDYFGYVDITREEFDEMFIDPWVNVLKVIGKELTKTIANVVVNVRLFFTFNKKKAEEILARHNDRLKALESEIDAIVGPLKDKIPGEAHMLGFLFNPTLYLGTQLASGKNATAVKDWFETIGVGDYEEGERDSPDKETDRLAREREQQGPVRKALRALNQIFLLAHHDVDGDFLMEQEQPEPSSVSDSAIGGAVKLSGLDEIAKKVQAAFVASVKDVDTALDGFQKQIKLLSAVAVSTTLDELNKNIAALKSALPDMDTKELENFKADVLKKTEESVKKPKDRENLAKEILRDSGISKPTPEEIEGVDSEKIRERALRTIFLAGTSDLRGQIVNQLENSLGVYRGLLKDLQIPTDMPAELKSEIESSPYGEALSQTNGKLGSLAGEVNSTVSTVKSFKPPKQNAEEV